MKKASRIILAALLSMASLAASVSCGDRIVTLDKLPDAAQAFIKEHFSEVAVSYVKQDRENLVSTYEVVLQDGTQLEFNSKGEWDKVDCKTKAVPASLIPAAIAEYVQKSFPGQWIVKIDRELLGYDIELSSGLDLKLSKDGKVLSVDD